VSDDFVWLEVPFHKNKVSFDIEEDKDLFESLKISFDGSIMAVKRSRVEDLYKKQNVSMIRAGYESLPKMKRDYKIDSKDELYKTLAYWISI
tara:strand:- start:5793 stop:6068 length:276 start_codon:yes stop_codon:yes gene_type:complete